MLMPLHLRRWKMLLLLYYFTQAVAPFSVPTCLARSLRFPLPGRQFPDTGSQLGKLGKTDVKKDLCLSAPSETRYPAGLVGVIKSRVIIYQGASLATHFHGSTSRLWLPTGTGFTGASARAELASPGFNPPPRHRSCLSVCGHTPAQTRARRRWRGPGVFGDTLLCLCTSQ